MSIKKILILPDPILRKKSEEIEKVSSEVQKLLDDMLETMYDTWNRTGCNTNWCTKGR